MSFRWQSSSGLLALASLKENRIRVQSEAGRTVEVIEERKEKRKGREKKGRRRDK